jgi:hypothetical protein
MVMERDGFNSYHSVNKKLEVKKMNTELGLTNADFRSFNQNMPYNQTMAT